ncbi:MAG: DUF3035 domain-containing protein [Pseudomonadota bacterium]
MPDRRFTNRPLIAAACAALVLAGCADSQDRNIIQRVTDGTVTAPEEFAVVPNNPLELPEDFASLPPPVAGAPNRGEIDPRSRAMAALSSSGTVRSTRSAADRALLAAVGAANNDPQIRARLEAEDRLYRQGNRGFLLDRMFGQQSESDIYRRKLLNQKAEMERMMAAGVRVPQSPPDP